MGSAWEHAGCPAFTRDGMTLSLSQREREGVRESGWAFPGASACAARAGRHAGVRGGAARAAVLGNLLRFLATRGRFLSNLVRFLTTRARFLSNLARFLTTRSRFLGKLVRFPSTRARFLGTQRRVASAQAQKRPVWRGFSGLTAHGQRPRQGVLLP